MKYMSIMRHKQPAITFLAAIAFAAGCSPPPERSATDAREAATQQFDKVKTETAEATQEMKDYAYAQKAEFVAKMQAQLDEINRDLDQLAAKTANSSEAAKAEAEPKIQALRDQTAKLAAKLDEAKGATESTWKDVEAGFRQGYSDLKDGFHQARQWVSDKIAP